MVVRPGIVGIDGEIQLSLAQLIDHRQQLALHDPHLYLRMLLMKTRYDSWHQTAGNTGPHADINLPCQLPLSLANILLRCAQLFKNKTGVLIKTFTGIS